MMFSLLFFNHWDNLYRRNILERTDKNYLHNCTFDKDDLLGRFCPIFVLSQTVADAGADWDDLTLNVILANERELQRGFVFCCFRVE